jgi:hypothetical protein
MREIIHAVAAVVVPLAWGLAWAFAFEWLARRRRRRAGSQGADK